MIVTTLPNGRMFIRETCVEITPEEIEIIKAYAEGGIPKTIAPVLKKSVRTIEAKIGNIRDKFDVKTTPQLVCVAKDLNLI